MPSNKPQMAFRLSAEQWRRFEKACRQRKQTKQAFVESAVLAEIADHEEQQRQRGVQVIIGPSEGKDSAPVGLGIANRMTTKPQSQSEIEAAPPQTPVVVNVGNGGGTNNSSGFNSIDLLATYVTTGNDFERDSRLRTSINILRTNTSTDEERRVLAAQLDEAIASKKKTTERGGDGNVIKTARIAFDKLAGILR